MTLLTTVFAALICTVIWYKNCAKEDMKLGVLSLMYWGASIMWLGDAIAEYCEIGAEMFSPVPVDMLHDFYLGLSVVALGMIIWLVILLVTDPKGTVRSTLFRKK